ncbi:DUF3025 domain-containing protein [Piscinibacter sp.]|uniref:DUF3025 domain-containing protein n=1 Tax=Piscinibacter sp. TaxID=1903157 RepID=UPI002D1E0425|nr:DUF3025 domain-containing protein [Albitalea sp.]HUG22412.1 DUF3025 domain-containing protein [Albitalea sp.]
MGFWRDVDWQRPWLGDYRANGEAACRWLDQGARVAETLNRLAEAAPPVLAVGPLRFVAQSALPAGEPYEAFIARTAGVPTRDNLHDLFNGLVWLRFPHLKRRLNERQAEQIALAGVSATRGAVRDALTLFDENAALWQAPPVLVDALRRRDWAALFVTHRALWSAAPLTLFGHALMEKLTQPRKPITAHVWVVPQGADAETHLVEALTPDRLATKPHLPLPVLGVPGWWPPNESRDFYADDSVFRPPLG